jgi:hypothetical protein
VAAENTTKGLAASGFPAHFASDGIMVYRCVFDADTGRAGA